MIIRKRFTLERIVIQRHDLLYTYLNTNYTNLLSLAKMCDNSVTS